MNPFTSLWRAIKAHPSAILLSGQLAAVLLYPFLGGFDVGRALLGVMSMLLVLAAIWAVRFTPTLAWVAMVLGLPTMVMTVAEALHPAMWVVVTSAALHAPFYFYVSYAMIAYLFHDDRVTRDELFATGAAFTVVAWAFAYIYSGVQALSPGAFVGPEEGALSWFELLFLSFSNLTSVGLSDILPANEFARSWVMVEQVVGVLYVALVVARLVGISNARAARAIDQGSQSSED